MSSMQVNPGAQSAQRQSSSSEKIKEKFVLKFWLRFWLKINLKICSGKFVIYATIHRSPQEPRILKLGPRS